MGQKVVTAIYIIIQCAFILCALVVVSSLSPTTPTTLVGAATFLVAYYTLGASSWRLISVYIASCRKSYSKKGDGPLTL